MLRLYHGTTAVCGIKVRLVLAEKNVDWASEILDLQKGDQFTPGYLKLNPNAVVPTLVHDGNVLVESSIIMTYLDEVFPQPPLQPADPLLRARMRWWMKTVDEKLHNAVGLLTYATVHRRNYLKLSIEERQARFAHVTDPALRERQLQAVEFGIEAPLVADAVRLYDKALADMERTLAHSPYLAGADYSLADAAITSYINRLEMLGLTGMWRSARPNVTAWLARVRARPSFDRAITAFFTDHDRRRYVVNEPEIWQKACAVLAAA